MTFIIYNDANVPTAAFECELPPLSVLFQRDVLGLDVGNVGVGVKCITDSDDVRLISYDVLDDGFRRGLCICRDDGSKQAIRFLWAWWCPTQRTEQVIRNDGLIVGSESKTEDSRGGRGSAAVLRRRRS